jgi:mono/diheme cytochrome c family protein
MMMRRLSILFPFAVAIALAASSKPLTAFRNAPAVAAQWSNPYAGQADAAAAGRKLFRYECAPCHGTDGMRPPSAPSLGSPDVRQAPAGALFWYLTHGDLKRGMPSWARLTAERRWQIVTYLQSR